MASALLDRYDDRIAGVLSCYDRVVITGTLPTVCYAAGMTRFLYARDVRIFDYPQFAATLCDRMWERAALLAAQAGIDIEHIAKSHIRKEAVVAKALETRGDHPGLVHVISAMEACDAYQPWHDKQTRKTYLRPDTSNCLHYYFYFLDDELGLIYLRAPTWAPFRLQFYCNGHSWLARRLAAEGIGFTAADNAFVRIDEWARAQELADGFSPDRLHRVLDHYAALCCPVLDVFAQVYHWSLMQVEYATDVVFRSAATLGPLYEQLTRQSVLSVKAEQIASFLGHKITPQLAQELGTQFSTRIEGTCIKHRFASSSIKMYDKFGCVLRIEIREDARKIGKATAALGGQILESRPHPEKGYRACLDIVRLAGSYGAARVEAAAEHAIEIGARTYGSVKSILDNKLDRRPAPRRPADTAPIPIPTSAGPATTIEENAKLLRHPTLDQLHALGLQGMAKAFADLAEADEARDLDHADWLAPLLDREMSWRRDKRLTARLRAARLRQQASVEDVDYRAARGLDRALFQ